MEITIHMIVVSYAGCLSPDVVLDQERGAPGAVHVGDKVQEQHRGGRECEARDRVARHCVCCTATAEPDRRMAGP